MGTTPKARRSRARLHATLLAATALIVGACSGGDDVAEPDAAPTTTSVVEVVPTTSTSTTTTVPAPPALAWRTEIDGGHDLVVVGPTQVFVLDAGSRVRALALDTGALLWQAPFGGADALVAQPVGGDVLVQAMNGARSTITRLDGATGGSVWRAQLESNQLVVLGEGDPQAAVVSEPGDAAFRRVDLTTGDVSEPVPGQPRVITAERLVTVDELSTISVYDLATLTVVAPPIEMGTLYSVDALGFAGSDLAMVSGNELRLLDETGRSLATGRVNAAPATLLVALGGERLLISGLRGTQLVERDAERFDAVWRTDGLGFAANDGDHDYVVVTTGPTLDIVDASAREPTVVGTVDLGGTEVADAHARMANGRLYVTAGGEHAAYDLASGVVKVWSIPAAEGDALAPFDGGVVRVISAYGRTAVELYR